jgi:hypothetical protein
MIGAIKAPKTNKAPKTKKPAYAGFFNGSNK